MAMSRLCVCSAPSVFPIPKTLLEQTLLTSHGAWIAHRPRDPDEFNRQHCERRQRTSHSMFQFDVRLSRNNRIGDSVSSAASNRYVPEQNFQENRRFSLRTAGFQDRGGLLQY